MASLQSVSATFGASMKSIGTAVTMAGVGFYLHYRNFVTKEGKRTLALMSQQVTFPLYFFTKICFCNQDWSDRPCPDVTKTLHDTWMLLLWPFFMVGMGKTKPVFDCQRCRSLTIQGNPSHHLSCF